MLIETVFIIIWEMFHGRISLNSASAAAASEFSEWVQVGIDVYIPHRKNQIKPHSSPWFSAAFAAAIVHRNHFFRLYQKDKSSDSKVKFRQVLILAKGFLKLPKLHMLIKQESITSQKLGPWDFWWIANSILNKGKSAIPPLFNSLDMLSSASDKAKLFLRTLILMTQVSFYLFSLLELSWNCIIFL